MKKKRKSSVKVKKKSLHHHIKHHKLFLIILASIVLLTLIVIPTIQAAFSWGGYSSYYNGPLAYLDNDWVLFGIIFAVFFAVIYMGVNKSFKNPGISAVIALSLSLLIAITIIKRTMFSDYFGETLGSYVIIAVILLAIAFIAKFGFSSFGLIGVFGLLIVAWFLLQGVDPYDIVPYSIQNQSFLDFFSLIKSFFVLIILIVGFIISVYLKIKHKDNYLKIPLKR